MQEKTDAQLEPFGRAVIDVLFPQPGERVLDVGCGAGQTLLELARCVGPSGRVVGVDVSEPLVARARERVRDSGFGQVEIVLHDAASVRFAQPFDVVFSRFGVMFFEDPVTAFGNLREALRPRGRLGFVCWQALELNAWAHVPLAAVRRLAPEQELPALFHPGRPGPFCFSDADLVAQTLERAGFEAVRVQARECAVTLGGAATLDEAIDYALTIGPAARFASESDSALAPRFRSVLAETLKPYAGAHGIRLPAQTYVVTALRGDLA